MLIDTNDEDVLQIANEYIETSQKLSEYLKYKSENLFSLLFIVLVQFQFPNLLNHL